MKKYTIGLILCFMIGLSGCGSVDNSSSLKDSVTNNNIVDEKINLEKSLENIEALDSKEESRVVIEEFQLDNSYYEVHMQIPNIKFLNEDVSVEINSEIKNNIMSYVDMIKNLKETMTEDELKLHSGMQKLYSGSEYRVTLETEDMVSLKGMMFEFTGGSHGNSAYNNYNYDLKTGKHLDLDKFFIEGYEFNAVIASIIDGSMKENPELYYDDIENLDEIVENSDYYMSENGIVVCVNTYALAPYAAGPQEFLIDKEILSNGLKEEYKKIWNIKK